MVCCYHSECHLRTTLEHLQQPWFTSGVPWEVLVVDNASSDKKVAWAQEIWDENPATSFQVVEEIALGLSYAWLKGIAEASYAFWALVDDEFSDVGNGNWVKERGHCPLRARNLRGILPRIDTLDYL